ncbi:MAG TPA: hypothetical protein PK362_03115, partial [Elusimicrobiota bacterium]|nr:hypothetical protein [Elusimicrobiota bacterium]
MAVHVQVHWITYDAKGREHQKNQSVQWTNSTYGMVPGLSDGRVNGWVNGNATVTITNAYDNADRLVDQQASGTVHSAYNANLAQHEGYFSAFGFSSHQYNMKYDVYGHLVYNDYSNYMPGTTVVGCGKHCSKTVDTMLWTSGGTSSSDFDEFGRAHRVYNSYSSSDGSNGWQNTYDIVYDNATGNVLTQSEQYHSYSPPVGKGGATVTDGLKIVTNHYDDRNELTTRDENKVWEHTETQGGGGCMDGIMGKLLMAVIMIAAIYIGVGFAINFQWAALGENLASMSLLDAAAAVEVGGVAVGAATVLTCVAVSTFVVSFAMTYMMTGNLEMSLISGLMAAASSVATLYMGSASFMNGGETSTAATTTSQSALGSSEGFLNEMASSISKNIASIFDVTGKAVNVITVAVKDFIRQAITIVVSDTFQQYAPDLGYLTGTITQGLLAFGGMGDLSKMLDTKILLQKAAVIAAGQLIDKALGPKNGWMSSLLMVAVGFKQGGTSAEGFSLLDPSKRDLWRGLMNSLATKANQLLQKRYAGEMSTFTKIVDGKVVGSKTTAAGFLLTDSVRNIGTFLGEQAARSFAPLESAPSAKAQTTMVDLAQANLPSSQAGLATMAFADLALTAANGDRAAGAAFRSSDDGQSANQQRTATLSDIESGKFNKELAGNADFVAAGKALGISDFESKLLKDSFNPIQLMMDSWSNPDRIQAQATEPQNDGERRIAVLDLKNLDAQSKANLLSLTKDELKSVFSSYDLTQVIGPVKLGLLGNDKVLIFEIKGSGIKEKETSKFIDRAGLKDAVVRVVHDLDSGKIFLDLTKQFKDGVIKGDEAVAKFMGFLKAAYGDDKSGIFKALSENLKALGGASFLEGATVKKFLVSVNKGVDGTVEIGKSFDSLAGSPLQGLAAGLGYGKGQEVSFQIDLKSGGIYMVSAAPMQIAGVTKDLTSKLTSAGVSSDDANKIKAALNAEAQGAFKLGVDLKLTARTMENGTIEGARVRFEGDVNLVNDATLNLGSLRGAGGEVSFTLTVDQGKASVGDQIDLKLNGQQASTLVQKVQNNEIKLDGRPLEAILKELQNLEASGFKEMTVHITKTGEGDKVQTRETVSVKVDESKVSAEIKAQ